VNYAAKFGGVVAAAAVAVETIGAGGPATVGPGAIDIAGSPRSMSARAGSSPTTRRASWGWLVYAERSNLNVRMHTRRFTRLTNDFSKKVENHAHSVALFVMYSQLRAHP
jgi:hypothetical protein